MGPMRASLRKFPEGLVSRFGLGERLAARVEPPDRRPCLKIESSRRHRDAQRETRGEGPPPVVDLALTEILVVRAGERGGNEPAPSRRRGQPTGAERCQWRHLDGRKIDAGRNAEGPASRCVGVVRSAGVAGGPLSAVGAFGTGGNEPTNSGCTSESHVARMTAATPASSSHEPSARRTRSPRIRPSSARSVTRSDEPARPIAARSRSAVVFARPSVSRTRASTCSRRDTPDRS